MDTFTAVIVEPRVKGLGALSARYRSGVELRAAHKLIVESINHRAMALAERPQAAVIDQAGGPIMTRIFALITVRRSDRCIVHSPSQIKAPLTSRQRVVRNRVSAAALVLAVGGLSGCSGVGAPRIPPTELGSINIGMNAEVGPVEVRNLLLVTRGEAEPARLIGVLLNGSEEDVQVTLSDQDDEVSVTLDPGEQYAFQEHPTLFETADDISGAVAHVTITVGADTESVQIPIRNGDLKWLEPYLPNSTRN
ncbi:hypothetical protein [Cryobacterium serini]|uniref:Uncharacterized protein n=1 Tax=Cryobacterium serini TaxID=1259201 RepID=A0A4R9BJ18_9MICO|nr:hypothetical protein [Cryobacterium serini]TFD85164.1 hypothetical protein E3T51_15020 [Cryobacterium serini]